MAESKIRIPEGGQWGIMTQRDIVKKIIGANRSPAMVKVGDIATRSLITVSADTPLVEVAQIMMERNIRRIIVVGAKGTPKGFVSDNALFHTVEEFGWEPHE